MKTFSEYFELQEGKKPPKNFYSYSSVLYLLPEKIAKKIYNWGLKNIEDKHLYTNPEEDRSYGRENEIHCTVLYGIHDKKSDAVRKLLKDTTPFDIKLGKLSVFTNPESFDVLKVEVTGKKLHNLHNLLCNNLEVTQSYPDYNPHVTIAYMKKGTAKPFIGNDVFSDTVMKVDEVVFSSRAGVKSPIFLKG